MKKYIIFLMLLIVSSFSLVQAETFGYGRTETIPINYSLIPTVNNSQYFDGYSISTLYTYYKSLFDDVYCKLTGCTMSGDIDMGGNDITNAGDITADNFIGDGSQLTDVWLTSTAQTGLTGDKTGSFDIETTGSVTCEEALINVGAGTNYLDISELNLNSFKGPYMVGRGDFGVRVIFIEGGNRLTTQIVNACDYGWYSRDNAKGHWNMEYTSSTDKLVLKKSTTTNNILWNEAIDYNFEDDYGVYFGTDSDAKVYYDGTDLIIDPKAVGSGKVNIDSDLNVSGNFTGNQIYGGMWYHNHTATQLNFAVDGTYYNMFMSNATHLNGFSYQGGFNQLSNLTAQIGGVYKVDYMSSGDGQNNHAYYTSVFINGVNQDNCESHHKMSAGGDIITQSGNCFIELDVSDVVEVKTANIGHSGTGNYYSANLNVVRMGD